MKSRPTPVRRTAHDGPALRRFAETYWAREPVVVTGTPPLGLTPADAHALLLAAAARPAPVPLRLSTSDGEIIEPGPLLPGHADRSLGAYVARLASAPLLDGDGWLLTVTDPLSQDFTAWSRVRDTLAALWRYVGWPAVPVTAELTVGDRHHALTEAGDLGAASLAWVVDGELTVRVRPEHTGTEYELHARAGDLLHWPAGSHHLDHRPAPCTLLRLSVPSRAGAAVSLVTDTAAGLARSRTPATPLPHPLPTRTDGRLRPPPQLATPTRLFTEALSAPALERALLEHWAVLRSTAGLIPAPAPRPAVPLTTRHRLLRASEIIRVAAGPHGDGLWAANGHVWPVRGRAADRLLSHLRTAQEPRTVADLARAAKLPARSPLLRSLLRELCRSRAVAVLHPEPRP